MKIFYKIILTRPGIIVMAALMLLLQSWYYRSYPVERFVEKVRTVTKYITKEIPVIREIIKPGRIIEKLVYVEVPAEPVEVVRIDTQYVEIEKIPRVGVLDSRIEDGIITVRILVGSEIRTYSIEVAPEGTTKITAVNTSSVQVRHQRWGLFSTLDIGVNSAGHGVIAADLIYINRFMFMRNLRLGPQVSFDRISGKWDGDIGLHIGWQPFPERNNMMIVPELYLFPERYFSVGLYTRLFKF